MAAGNRDDGAIVCVIGTRAQLIKMAPVMLALEAAGTPFRLVLTGQHAATMDELLAEFGVATPPRRLYDGAEVSGIGRMATWLPRVLWRALTSRRALFATTAKRRCVLVHGDTFSTLLGALIGRLRGFEVVHVESGLTSGRWREPFPEELTRRLVFRLADLALCPGAWATENMRRYRCERIDTGANTIVDAVRVALAAPAAPPAGQPPRPYGVVSLHRFENIFDRERLGFIVSELEAIAARVPLAFVLHPATRSQALKFGLLPRLEQNGNIYLLDRMTYVPFQHLVADSHFVITDGGSNQEELSLLGKPTLLMRGATERREGLDDNVVLSRYDPAVIRGFVDDALATEASRPPELPAASPAATIAAALRERYGALSVP